MALTFTLGAGLTACSGEEGAAGAPGVEQRAGTEGAAVLSRGARGPEVRQVYEYLKRYGYLPNDALKQYPGWKPAVEQAPADPELFDGVLEEAVRLFQGAHGLKVDGTLNAETAKLMRSPRCGFPDLYGANARRPGEVGAQFVYSGYRWNTPNLSYRFVNYTPDLPSGNSRAALIGAFQRWEAVTTFNFTEVGSGGDILIGWYNGDHGDGYPFDGPSNVLAHAFYPTSGWGGSGGFDLPSVALHELGHALGLAHSSDTSAVMYAYYSGVNREPRQDDISGIMSIYGVRAVASWSQAGPIAGKYCTQIHEGADPYTWQDNYFCTDTFQDIRWDSAAPIPGMRCTQVYENSDPHTWQDNWLCVPGSSPFYFAWSQAGPIPGRRCVQWYEFADPHAWGDNYLCY